MTSAKLKWYSDIKVELSKYGLPVDEISQIAKVVAGIKQCGFDANKILDEISNLEMLKAEYKGHQGSIPILKDQHDALRSRCYYLQQMILYHNDPCDISGTRGYGLWSEGVKTIAPNHW
jgi:hypothetical protein